MFVESDFTTWRKVSRGPVERILVEVAKLVEGGVFFGLVSMSVSKFSFVVIVNCEKSWGEVKDVIAGIE